MEYPEHEERKREILEMLRQSFKQPITQDMMDLDKLTDDLCDWGYKNWA